MNKLLLVLLFVALSFAVDYNFYVVNGIKFGSKTTDSMYETLDSLQKKAKTPLMVQQKASENQVIFHKENSIVNIPFLPEKDTFWIEAEKNQSMLICFEDRSINTFNIDVVEKASNDSCIYATMPSVISLVQLSVKDSYLKDVIVNLVVGMKYLDLHSSVVKLGYNGEYYTLKDGQTMDIEQNRIYQDPERYHIINAKYLVDKYPVTNCEFMSLMYDELNFKHVYANGLQKNIDNFWKKRRDKVGSEKCVTNDSAANVVFLYQALVYANKRSLAEGLEPYYIIEKTNFGKSMLFLDSSFIVLNSEIRGGKNKNSWVKVTVNSKSNGYRLPYYDEWMIFARGGDSKGTAIWGDSSVVLKKVLEYAWIGDLSDYDLHLSKPVGLLQPNGYGLYDVFGLVGEFVLFPGINPFKNQLNSPSCLKGGDYKTRINYKANEIYINPYWKELNYGYSKITFGGGMGGFRLVRRLN